MNFRKKETNFSFLNLKINQLALFISLLLMNNALSGQVSFKNVNDYVNSVYTGIAVLAADMNNDNQDDLIYFDESSRLVVQLNNGLKRSWIKIDGPALGGKVWSATVADIDNDGRKEIICGTASVPIRIYTFDYLSNKFILYWQEDTAFFVQNMNCTDINNDGWIDLFVCDDLGENKIYINDKNGDLSAMPIIDFSTIPASDKSGNYGSIFIDFDLDGDRDLYISKCSADASSPADPRRINQLYVNDGNGNFEDQAALFNLDVGAQTWVSDFADIDLDGDFDVVIANHEYNLQIFENKGNGVYEEIQANSGVNLMNSFWELSLQDMDNDGYPDIILTGDDIEYYHNNGNKTFTLQKFENKKNIAFAFSYSIGDYNNDGFLDLNVGYGGFFNGAYLQDSIWLNEGNSNNWISFHLEGTTVNRDAEGTRIDVFTGGKQIIKIVKIGHSYGIQDTKDLYFGLAQNQVDSVKIYWSSDDIQVINSISENQKYFIKQGECIEKIATHEVNSILCEGDNAQVNFQGDHLKYWPDGSSNSEFSTDSKDVIFAVYGKDCMLESWKIYPVYLDTTSIEKLSSLKNGIYQPCQGQDIILDAPNETAIWNNTGFSPTYTSTINETILVSYTELCQNISETITRVNQSNNFISPPNVINYTKGQNVTIDVNNDVAKWYDESGDNLIHEGAKITFENVQQDDFYQVVNYIESTYESSVGLKTKSITGGYPSNTVNAFIEFTVIEPIRLKSIDVFANVPGIRKVNISDAITNVILFSKSQFIDENTSLFELEAELEPGSYFLSTDVNTNLAELGTQGPLLWRDLNILESYPFVDESSTIRIENNGFGNDKAYYSFYNWQVESISPNVCDYEKYIFKLEDVNAIEEKKIATFTYNNPFSNELIIQARIGSSYFILNQLGQQIEQGEIENERQIINTANFSAGSYILKVDNQSKLIHKM